MADNETNELGQAPADSSPDSQEHAAPKPGARLAEYREKAGMTVEQVASRLKMTNRQVQQIEADNYESMYSMAIARGFIRAYAKLLNVDGEPLAAMLPADKQEISLPVQPRRGAHESFIGNRQPFRSSRGFPGKSIGMLVAALIIVVGAFIAWRGGWLPSFGKTPIPKDLASQELQSRKSASKEPPQKEKAAATGSVSTELAAPKTTVITEESQKPSSAPAQEAAQAEQSASATSAAAPAASPAASEQASVTKSESAAPVLSKSKGALVLRARQDTWVQILRSDSTVLYERTLKPGQTETLEIREPVTVTIGYAPGIEATFRGSRLELKTAEGSTVARLNLK